MYTAIKTYLEKSLRKEVLIIIIIIIIITSICVMVVLYRNTQRSWTTCMLHGRVGLEVTASYRHCHTDTEISSKVTGSSIDI